MTAFPLPLRHRHRHRHRHVPFTLTRSSRLRFSASPSSSSLSYLKHHPHLRQQQHQHSFLGSSVSNSQNSHLSTTPVTTPTSSALSSSSSSPQPSQYRYQPNWMQMSRHARYILTTISSPTEDIDAFETQLESQIALHPQNPFLWHSLLTQLSTHRGATYSHLKTIASQSIEQVPEGSRGILFHFIYQHIPSLLPPSSPATDDPISHLSQVAATDPYPLLYTILASAHARNRDFNLARLAYKEGVKTFSNNAHLWRSWAFFEIKYGSKQEALHACREALDRDPGNAKAWRALLKLQTAFGAGEAHLVDVLMEALTACPTDPVLRLQLARIVERRKGGKAAYEILKPVQHVGHPDVMRMIGRILFDQGDWNSGRTYLRRAADIDNDDGNSNNNKRHRQRHDSRNHEQVAGAVNGDDNNEEEIDNLSATSRVSSMKKKKRETATNVRKDDQFSRKQKAVKALHAWSLMESKVGNIDEARALLSEAKALCQTDAGIWRAIAELEARERNYEKARRAFQNALDIDPNDGRVLLA